MRIGTVEISHPVALGPMAGVTDLPFRRLCREMGCGLLYTEMVSAKALSYHNKNTDFRSYFLSFDDGSRLEIMTRPDISDLDKPLSRTGFVHIAFSVGSKEKVNQMTEQFKLDGYQVISGPRTTGDGYYESCMLDFEGNQIEITI